MSKQEGRPQSSTLLDVQEQLQADVLKCLGQARGKLLADLALLAEQQDAAVASQLAGLLRQALARCRAADSPLADGGGGDGPGVDEVPADQLPSPLAAGPYSRPWRGGRTSAPADNGAAALMREQLACTTLARLDEDGHSPPSSNGQNTPAVAIEVRRSSGHNKPARASRLDPSAFISTESADSTATNTSGVKGLKPWPVWEEEEEEDEGEEEALVPTESRTSWRRLSRQRSNRDSPLSQSASLKSGDHIRESGILQRIIAGPTSWRKICWDLLTVVLLSYELLMIPMEFFDLESSGFSAAVSWITTLFWTIDICVSFTVGYADGGVIEMRPRKIALRYAKTWLPLDIVLVAMDWLYQVAGLHAGSASGMLRIVKSARLMRLMRVLRLLRIWKLMLWINRFADSVPSELISTSLHIVKMVAGIALINHFIACAWYAVATDFAVRYPGYAGSWVDDLYPAEDDSLAYRYTTALHWSLTQFTPASMEVVPRNACERVFTITVIIIAMVVFSSLISTITSSMTHLRETNRKREEERDYLRRYIIDRQISIGLGARLRSFLAKHQNQMKVHIHEADIPCLREMPDILQMELHSEVFKPLLEPLPFFHHYMQHDSAGAVSICHQTMAEASLLTGKELFLPGQDCKSMYFVIAGVCKYSLDGKEGVWDEVAQGAQLCEMVLWVQWRHLGRLVAGTHCELVALQAGALRGLLSKGELRGSCRLYARLYRELLQERGFDAITDVWQDFDACQEIAQRAFERNAATPPAVAPTAESSLHDAFRRLQTSLGKAI